MVVIEKAIGNVCVMQAAAESEQFRCKKRAKTSFDPASNLTLELNSRERNPRVGNKCCV